MPSNGPAPDGPKPPASPAGPPASDPAPEPHAANPLPWPWTEETAEHVLAISLERLEEIKRLRAEIERLKRAAPDPATEEMLELCRDTIDRQWLNAPSLELCHKFLAEHGRSYPTVGTTAPVLSSLRADLKVKKTPDVDE